MVKWIIGSFATIGVLGILSSQPVMTPELLWSLGRVSALGVTVDGQVVYQVSTPSMSDNRSKVQYYQLPVDGGNAININDPGSRLRDKHLSPDGKYLLEVREVKLKPVYGVDFYPELDKSNVQIYDELNYRHWDTWEDGKYSHLIMRNLETGAEIDFMEGQPFDSPQKPFGGEEDYTWSPDGKMVVYVTKRKSGTDYALSTDTDILAYTLTDGTTRNLSEGRSGYDVAPSFSAGGKLAWLSMKRDGYESDKNDIVVLEGASVVNLTSSWNGTVDHFHWSADEKSLFFSGAVDGTVQLFEVQVGNKEIRQITRGDFDITGIAGEFKSRLVVTRTDMNRAAEIYTVEKKSGSMVRITRVNDEKYDPIAKSKIERKYITTTDGQKMLVWVIYPPGFDPGKKYPALLYCQGGPQSALSQFYSYRWNFQLMASQGYIVIAPNRRGMPGHGVLWNEQISKDHGGQVMDDYLVAVDSLSKESFIDRDRIACVGASYGGYSAFFLAGIHQKRFKTFIAHDGIFNLKSMYGTTEELFFVNWDYGGAWWDNSNEAAQKTYQEFDPKNLVTKWDTPILIIQGGRDYRVPDGQAMEAFQSAQLLGIKSRFIYFPEENHWVLKAQNALVWQREFFKWLKETM